MKCLTNSNQIKDSIANRIKRHQIQLHLDRDNTDIATSNRTLLTQDNSSCIDPQRIKHLHLKKNLKNISNHNTSTQTQKTIPKKTISDTSKDLIIIYKPKSNNSLGKDEDDNHQYIPIQADKYFQCIFCEKYIKKDITSSRIECSHKFCYKCGKAYYEGKIEEGYYKQFKCCVFTCESLIGIEILNALLSKTHLEVINKEGDKKHNEVYTNNIDLLIYFDNTKRSIIKDYSIKHLLDVNTNFNFFQYNSNKQMVCPLCRELALYGKTDQHFVKCFNCFYKLCKHCMLEFNVNHMNYTSELRCKVYYRRSKAYPESLSVLISQFCLNILLLFAGFLLISSVVFGMAKNALMIKNKCKRVLCFIIYLIIAIITLPIFLMSLPYYPLLNCMF